MKVTKRQNRSHKVLFVLCLLGLKLQAQDSLSAPAFKLCGYLEVYYSYDLAQPADHQRPYFFYNYTRHNEVNLNLGFIKASYSAQSLRANLAVMAGNYAQYNMASEPPTLRAIYEANVGARLLSKHKLWLDAGIMPSHIGLESATGRDNWELSRSIVADNSPYYESGVRLSYSNQSEKLYLAGYYLNGWQRITRLAGNQTPAFGSQLSFKPSGRLTFNWSTFAGNVYPDSVQRWRYYNNLYVIWQLHPKFGITGAVDLGLEQQQTGSKAYNNWWAPLLLLQYKFTTKTSMTLRGEYFSDKKEVVISNIKGGGFYTMGYSANIDHAPNKYLLLRLEARWLQSKDAIYTLNNIPSFNNYCLSACIALTL